MYLGDKDIKFLNNAENRVMQHLVAAYKEFHAITMDDQQSAMDLVNFGHYLHAAQQALLVRGARRLDVDNLLNRSMYPTDNIEVSQE